MTDLTGKTAIVTGASRGIGRAICQRLTQAGARVLINYAGNEKEAEITQSLCKDSILYKTDVSDFESCQAMFRFCEETLGAPSILVNNAGITRDNLVMRMTAEDFDRVISVNLRGAFNCVKLACRAMMKERFGRIVNITSVVGLSGNAGQINYAASKAGLIGLTKSAAKEFASRGITVNAVAPGFIDTDMTAVLDDAVKTGLLASIPQARFGCPEDVAGAVSFLCSDDAAYITGQVLSVDGGMHM